MRASALQTLLAFGSLASASLPSAFRAFKPAAGVHPRQAFDPETETRVASDCTDFGPNYVMCVPGTGTFVDPPLCIDPTIGETCCDRKWGCPASSFCLIQDLCCPDGFAPKDCAVEYKVDLPTDFENNRPSTDTPTADPTSLDFSPSRPTGTPSGDDDDESSGDDDDESSGDDEASDPPVSGGIPTTDEGGASGNKASILAAIVGLAAFAL